MKCVRMGSVKSAANSTEDKLWRPRFEVMELSMIGRTGYVDSNCLKLDMATRMMCSWRAASSTVCQENIGRNPRPSRLPKAISRENQPLCLQYSIPIFQRLCLLPPAMSNEQTLDFRNLGLQRCDQCQILFHLRQALRSHPPG